MKITSTEFQQNVGRYQDAAMKAPLTITKNGRDHMVLMSADEFERLMRRNRQVYRADEVPDDILAAIATAEPSPESEAVELELAAEAR